MAFSKTNSAIAKTVTSEQWKFSSGFTCACGDTFASAKDLKDHQENCKG